MATDRQITANRANATHSTGPRTADGKTASKLNRLSHGIHSDAPVVPGERAEDWEAHRAGIREALAPVGPFEAALVDRAALLFWRMNRVARFETGAATEAIGRAVGALTGEFDPADPITGTFGTGNGVPLPKSVAGLRYDLGAQRACLERLGTTAALIRDLATLPDDHRIPDHLAGELLDEICQDELLTGIGDAKVLCDTNLPDEAREDLLGWDGWTAGLVRAALAELAGRAHRTPAQLLGRAGRQAQRETVAVKREIALLEEAVARAEADLEGAVERARQVNLLPAQATAQVIRYEAHLSRQLTQTLQLLDQLQATRRASQARLPAAMTPTEFRESECAPLSGRESASTERTQSGPANPPTAPPRPVPTADRKAVSTERTQSASEVPAGGTTGPHSPAGRVVVCAERTQTIPGVPAAVAAGRVQPADRAAVCAERTQLADRSPLLAASATLSGGPDGVLGRVG